jgi:hypothetical protein
VVSAVDSTSYFATHSSSPDSAALPVAGAIKCGQSPCLLLLLLQPTHDLLQLRLNTEAAAACTSKGAPLSVHSLATKGKFLLVLSG